MAQPAPQLRLPYQDLPAFPRDGNRHDLTTPLLPGPAVDPEDVFD